MIVLCLIYLFCLSLCTAITLQYQTSQLGWRRRGWFSHVLYMVTSISQQAYIYKVTQTTCIYIDVLLTYMCISGLRTKFKP
jgi:hypothetical protein